MQHDTLKTTVGRAGYVGLATAVGLVEQSREIALVDQDPERLDEPGG